MMAVRLGPLTDLFALVGPDALTRLSRLGEESFGLVSLSFPHPRHWKNLSGPQARACRAREDRFGAIDATDAIGGGGGLGVLPNLLGIALGKPSRSGTA